MYKITSKTAKQQNSKTAKQQNSKTAKQQNSKTAKQQNSKTAKQQNSKTAKWSSLSKFLTFCLIAFFSVHCSKKKGGGLGLGILALAGGGGSSSSSSGDSTDKPKDDPNNDPEFDEVKKKIESTIKFPTKNENKVLKNNNDYKAVDLSITGEFFQDLKNHKDLEVEHQVFAGDEETTATTIPITEEFITNQKIPLVLDLSSLQPETGFTQPKLSLKFSSEKRQIILKEWTQNFFLKGKKQTPVITYKDKNDQEKTVEDPFISDYILKNTNDFNEKMHIKVSVPKGIPQKIETNIKVKALNWNTGPHNATFSPSLSPPTQADGIQNFKEFLFKRDENYTIASQLFYRLKGTKNWSSTTPFTNYYRLYDITNAFKIKVNKFLIKKKEKLILNITIPKPFVTNKPVKFLILRVRDIITGDYNPVFILTGSDGSEMTGNVITANRTENDIESIDHKPKNTELKPNQDYTIDITFKENIERMESIMILIQYDGSADYTKSFRIKLDKKN